MRIRIKKKKTENKQSGLLSTARHNACINRQQVRHQFPGASHTYCRLGKHCAGLGQPSLADSVQVQLIIQNARHPASRLCNTCYRKYYEVNLRKSTESPEKQPFMKS
ncbi:MAG: hypothetical protein V3U75_09960 [Methylococcaceae bacterium]